MRVLTRALRVLTRALLVFGITMTVMTPAGATPDVGPTRWTVAWAATVPYYGSVMASDAEGTVIVGYDGEVTALAVDGTERWTTDLELEEAVIRPVLVDGVVVISSADTVVAVARTDGAALWRAEMDAPRLAAAERAGRPALLAATPDGLLRVLDPRSGTVLVEEGLPAPAPDGAPVIEGSGDVAVVAWGSPGQCCTVAAFGTSDGQELWRRTITERSTVPLVHDGLVVIAMNEEATGAASSRKGRVVAFDAATGERRWRTPVRGRFQPTLEGDAADDEVVVTTRGGAAIALDANTGTLRWESEPTIAAGSSHPEIAAAHVFLTPHSTDLVAFDRSTGEVVSAGPIEQTIVVTDTDVVDGRFQLLVTNGLESQIWNVETDGLHPGR